MEKTQRRRAIQLAYNQQYNITPTSVKKSKADILKSTSVLEIRKPKADSTQQEELVETTSRFPLTENNGKKKLNIEEKPCERLQRTWTF